MNSLNHVSTEYGEYHSSLALPAGSYASAARIARTAFHRTALAVVADAVRVCIEAVTGADVALIRNAVAVAIHPTERKTRVLTPLLIDALTPTSALRAIDFMVPREM